MTEDDIDSQALQAQIDLSLSFAHSLVSSWVKPSAQSTKNSGRVLEAELKEYMRRPPRLGVGAAIPEAASSSRDTERLKSCLSGKNKRSRGADEDADAAGPKRASDEDEDGARGASSKKKARIDPFDLRGKKNKGKEVLAPSMSSPLPKDAASETKKKKKRKSTGAPRESLVNLDTSQASFVKETTPEQAQPASVETSESAPLSPALLSASQRKKKKKKTKYSLSQSEAPSDPPPALSGEATADDTVDVSAPQAHEMMDTAPVPPPRSAPKSVFTGPLLNLDGPLVSDAESDGEGEGGLGSSPSSLKKKRRRKKKKKKGALGVQAVQS